MIKHHGLPESVAMIADGLGVPVDTITETIEPMIAQENITTEFLEVPRDAPPASIKSREGFRWAGRKLFWN